MNKIILFSLYLLCINSCYSQVEADENLFFNGNTYSVFNIKIDVNSLSSFDILSNNTLEHNSLMRSIDGDLSFFAINACINDSNCSPVGYFVKDYIQIKPINLDNGIGNFFLKPNGAFMVTNNEVVICESSLISQYKNIRLAVQSGPMLLIDKIINAQFNPNSVNKYIRCGVGIYENKSGNQFIVFALSKTPISFYEFATFFAQKYNCINALCLESSNCVINLPDISDGSEFNGKYICNYIIFKSN
jgi:uncharacterized protein YigE (DUF2233 family)